MIEFRILGPLEVVDHEPLSLGGHKQQAVLAVLLLHRGEAIAADRLIEALWAGRAPATAAKTLQVYISNLRKPLGEGLLLTQGRGYLLAAEPDQVDSDRFEKLAVRGREALEHGDVQRARMWLEAALGLWRGPALADFSYESFAQAEIARLEEVRMATLESRIEADLRLGRHVALVPELEALVHEHPLRERLYEQLMIALYRSGRQVDALDRYQRARRKLIDEFGIEPGPRLQEVQRAVLTHDSALDLPGRRRLRPRPAPGKRASTAPARRLALGVVARFGGLSGPLSGLRRRVGPLAGKAGRRSGALAALGGLVIVALVLVLTVGSHSGAHAHKPGALTGRAAISSPTQGGVYPQGQWVATTFSCGQAAGGPAVTSCRDSTGAATVSGGQGHLDTSSIGLHRYTVAATAKNGRVQRTGISYTVVPAPRASLATAVVTAAHSRTNVTVACSGGGAGMACSGVLSLTANRQVVRRSGRRRTATVQTFTVARANYSVAAGARKAIVVPLTNAGTLALRAASGHRMRVRATITVSDGATAERTITLKRRQRR